MRQTNDISMKKVSIISCLCLLISLILSGCNSSNDKKLPENLRGLKQIIFIDKESYSEHEYKINLSDTIKLFLTRVHFKDWECKPKNLKEFNGELLLKVIDRANLHLFLHALEDFNYKDTIVWNELSFEAKYLEYNSDRIAKSTTGYYSLSNSEKDCFLNKIKDELLFNSLIPSTLTLKKTGDYPECEISLIYERDTISYYSKQQSPYMLPFITEKGKLYNPQISKFFASIIPNKKYSNKTRLEGIELLEKDIARSIIKLKCD